MTYRDPTTLKDYFGWHDLVDSVHVGWVPVTAKGAKGDGSTDDTMAFQEAASEAGANGTVVVPPGDYRLSGSVELDSGASLVGFGPGSRITWTAAVDRGITNADRTNGNSRVAVSGLRLDGADLCNDPIEFVKVTDGIVDRVWATQGNHDNVEFDNCTRCILSNSILDNANTFDGAELDSCTDCIVTGCLSHSNQQDGFNIGGTTDHCSVLSCYAVDNTRGGFLAAANTVRNTVIGYASDNLSNYSDSGTNNLFDVAGGDRFDFSVGDVLTARLRSGEFHSVAGTSAPADGNVPTSHISFWLNEGSNQLTVKAKYSDGSTVRSGTIALS